MVLTLLMTRGMIHPVLCCCLGFVFCLLSSCTNNFIWLFIWVVFLIFFLLYMWFCRGLLFKLFVSCVKKKPFNVYAYHDLWFCCFLDVFLGRSFASTAFCVFFQRCLINGWIAHQVPEDDNAPGETWSADSILQPQNFLCLKDSSIQFGGISPDERSVSH